MYTGKHNPITLRTGTSLFFHFSGTHFQSFFSWTIWRTVSNSVACNLQTWYWYFKLVIFIKLRAREVKYCSCSADQEDFSLGTSPIIFSQTSSHPVYYTYNIHVGHLPCCHPTTSVPLFCESLSGLKRVSSVICSFILFHYMSHEWFRSHCVCCK